MVEGKPRQGPKVTAFAVVFQNQLETTVIRMLERDDVTLVEVSQSTEKEFMKFQKERRKEERDAGGGAGVPHLRK